jgi:uncharacterized heparinase superfamily protein
MNPMRYFHTLRHLRPVQFYSRAWFRLMRPAPDTRPAPRRRNPKRDWIPNGWRSPAMLAPHTFRFLGQTREAVGAASWNDASAEKLWLYNLHYFDDLVAADAAQREAWHVALIERWIDQNPPGHGNGWEPYPMSLRIVNWIKWIWLHDTADPRMLHSLAVQTRYLARRLEHHLLGNHLFANAKALVFAGLFFEGEQADAWFERGMRLLRRELDEQILEDGGHFELSPMYHAIALEDVLDLLNAARVMDGRVAERDLDRWRAVAMPMLEWLRTMSHPDGKIAFFNDAAHGIAADVAELAGYMRRLGLAPRAPAQQTRGIAALTRLQHSGYIRVTPTAAVALLDVAPVGPDHLPGHAHADTLSFELSVRDHRFIVNGGTSCYGSGPQRLHERSTAAHSTVEVAGQDSSEVWGGFRVARRAYPRDLQIDDGAGSMRIACSHDGYRRLGGQPVHRRAWIFEAQDLIVDDTVAGGSHAAIARFLIHPAWQVEKLGDGKFQCTGPKGARAAIDVEHGTGRLQRAGYAPCFGTVLDASCIEVALVDGRARTRLSWS